MPLESGGVLKSGRFRHTMQIARRLAREGSQQAGLSDVLPVTCRRLGVPGLSQKKGRPKAPFPTYVARYRRRQKLCWTASIKTEPSIPSSSDSSVFGVLGLSIA